MKIPSTLVLPQKCVYVFFIFVDCDAKEYRPEIILQNVYNNCSGDSMDVGKKLDNLKVLDRDFENFASLKPDLASVLLNSVKNWYYRLVIYSLSYSSNIN